MKGGKERTEDITMHLSQPLCTGPSQRQARVWVQGVGSRKCFKLNKRLKFSG